MRSAGRGGGGGVGGMGVAVRDRDEGSIVRASHSLVMAFRSSSLGAG